VPEIVELILIKTHLSREFGFSHLKRDIGPWLTIFAPILISFCLRLVSDQSFMGFGVASVRRKLPRF
jgi:hypothetical protein